MSSSTAATPAGLSSCPDTARPKPSTPCLLSMLWAVCWAGGGVQHALPAEHAVVMCWAGGGAGWARWLCRWRSDWTCGSWAPSPACASTLPALWGPPLSQGGFASAVPVLAWAWWRLSWDFCFARSWPCAGGWLSFQGKLSLYVPRGSEHRATKQPQSAQGRNAWLPDY